MGGRGSSLMRGRLARPSGEERRPEEERERESFHYFYDKARDGFHYEGDGHHQLEWFSEHTNIDEIADNLTTIDMSAMRYWIEGRFMLGGQYRGWDNMDRLEKLCTQTYDDLIDRSTLDRGVTVVRRTTAELIFGAGHKTATLAELQAAEGRIVESKANISTGAAAEGLTIGGYKKHEFRIHIPGGSTGAGMWIGDPRINKIFGVEQREFMMNRDISVRVGKTTYDSSKDIYVTDLTYIGRQEHDYGKTGRIAR